MAAAPAAARLGREGAPVLVIDGFAPRPAALVEAASQAVFTPVTERLYPGVRAPAPDWYRAHLVEALLEPAQRCFRSCEALWVSASDFSIVTTPPEALTPYQRVPHFDTHDPRWIAVVHYLCGAQFGGTSFYRHRGTGFEVIVGGRKQVFLDTLDGELHRAEAPHGYHSGDSPLFERIGGVEAQFNRAAVYLCASLHSGDIDGRRPLAADAHGGRLTISSFLRMT